MHIQFIFNQLKTVLEGEGVTQFGKVGDVFDPNLHESMETVITDNESKNDIIESILVKGYKMNDSILRPAKVKTWVFKK